jgi:hypothetical protein
MSGYRSPCVAMYAAVTVPGESVRRREHGAKAAPSCRLVRK